MTRRSSITTGGAVLALQTAFLIACISSSVSDDLEAQPQREETMRRFTAHLVTEIDFVDGDDASDAAAQNYQKHLSDTLQNAARGLSLRTIKASRVERLSRSKKPRQPAGFQAGQRRRRTTSRPALRLANAVISLTGAMFLPMLLCRSRTNSGYLGWCRDIQRSHERRSV